MSMGVFYSDRIPEPHRAVMSEWAWASVERLSRPQIETGGIRTLRAREQTSIGGVLKKGNGLMGDTAIRIATLPATRRKTMNPFTQAFGFFRWIGISHYLNLLLVGFMGVAERARDPECSSEALLARRLWSRAANGCACGRKKMPADRLWTGADEETSFPSFIALPQGQAQDVGRR